MKKVTVKEFIWYAGCALVAVLGIICIVFGWIGRAMPKTAANGNFVEQFESKIHIELIWVGLIAIAVAVVVAVIALLVNAKKADRDVEKKLRREQRIAAAANNTIEVKKAVEIVEEAPAQEAK